MALRAGRLNERITIERPVTTRQAPMNEPTVTSWAPVAVVWAAVKTLPRGSGEREVQAQVQAVAIVEVTLRHRTDLQPTWRLTQGTRHLDITSWEDPDGTREQLTVRCIERVGR